MDQTDVVEQGAVGRRPPAPGPPAPSVVTATRQPRTSHITRTGQTPRCSSTNPNFTGRPLRAAGRRSQHGRGYEQAFAEQTFRQLEGFGSYGFPESRAASFALIAYASSWMKCWHPDVFCCALLNAQPMGFYAPAQIVRDARERGVEARPVCVNRLRGESILEVIDGEDDGPLT